jgi:PIN domain nuclease of toxin-antitoxin system
VKLLDTNVLLFLALDRSRISPGTLAAVTAPDAGLHVSPVSAIEIAIKSSLGKLALPNAFRADFQSAFSSLVDRMGATLLDIDLHAISRLQTLPLIHKDPFDRLLIAQALEYDLEIVSSDGVFGRYAGLKVLAA